MASHNGTSIGPERARGRMPGGLGCSGGVYDFRCSWDGRFIPDVHNTTFIPGIISFSKLPFAIPGS